METPYNQKLHEYLMANGYKCHHNPRCDRYDKGDITVLYFNNGYIIVLDKDEPAKKYIFNKIVEVANAS
jgi:hypothetical protein